MIVSSVETVLLINGPCNISTDQEPKKFDETGTSHLRANLGAFTVGTMYIMLQTVNYLSGNMVVWHSFHSTVAVELSCQTKLSRLWKDRPEVCAITIFVSTFGFSSCKDCFEYNI